MSVWKNIGRAFGFGADLPDPEEEVWQQDDAATEETQNVPLAPVEVDEAKVHAIFHRVVEVFNNTLPDFLARSTDPEKQRKYLYDSLDNSVKNYLQELQQQANDYCASQWQAERERLEAEAAQLKKHTEELEAKKSEMTDKQLSTERQKRALSERVRDLEDQVLRLEAEKEQLDIENKCMINKAKAAAVLEAEIDELRKENLRLNTACQEHESQEATQAENTITPEQLEEIQQQIARFEDVKMKLDGRIDKLRASLKNAQAENNSLRDTIKDNMLSHAKIEKELNDKIAKLSQQLEDASNTGGTQDTPAPYSKPAEKKRREKRYKKPTEEKIADGVDDLINGADWMVSSPPEESPMRAQTDSDGFGYQEPPRKPRGAGENEGQMSLFDF